MRTVPAAMTNAWKSEDKTGANRPVLRATIQRARMRWTTYAASDTLGENPRIAPGHLGSLLFGEKSTLRELPNLLNFSWTRSVDQDVTEATLTLENTELVALGIVTGDEFDLPGALSPTRGDDGATNPWGYTSQTGWHQAIIPDRIVRTYEGYGDDPNVWPADDPNLLQSGTWLIDDVDFDDEGNISIRMRDIGRLLMDMIVFPPCVPWWNYPMVWSKYQTVSELQNLPTGGAWRTPSGRCSSSNTYYVGQGIQTSTGEPYVGAGGVVQGHRAKDALLSGPGEYWLSTGQNDIWDTDPRAPAPRTWWQVNFDDPTTNVAAVRVIPKNGPYAVYVSLMDSNGNWLGRRKIPYRVETEGVDIQAGIPYSKTFIVDADTARDMVFDRPKKGIKAMRLTFGWMPKNGNDTFHPRTAALNGVKIYTAKSASALKTTKQHVNVKRGNYVDWTDVVVWMCAWAGYYWPDHASGEDFQLTAPNEQTFITDASGGSTVLPSGNIWGDFQKAGTAGIADLTPDLFDKQPLWNVVTYVRDLLGYVAFTDETGGFIFRQPNIWQKGNYLSPNDKSPRGRTRTTDVVTLSDVEVIKGHKVTLSSRDLRERVLVGNSTGSVGTVSKGFNPGNTNFLRMAIWTDGKFDSMDECKITADLIVSREAFSYRQAQIKIPGYPALQIDDQVIVQERVTNETSHHYIKSITSTIDMRAGTWDYDLTTNWLVGEGDKWIVTADRLGAPTHAFLTKIGSLS